MATQFIAAYIITESSNMFQHYRAEGVRGAKIADRFNTYEEAEAQCIAWERSGECGPFELTQDYLEELAEAEIKTQLKASDIGKIVTYEGEVLADSWSELPCANSDYRYSIIEVQIEDED
jgi:hypothetical protein